MSVEIDGKPEIEKLGKKESDLNNNSFVQNSRKKKLHFPSIEIPATVLPWKNSKECSENKVVFKKFKRKRGNLDQLLPRVEARKRREEKLLQSNNLKDGNTSSTSWTQEQKYTSDESFVKTPTSISRSSIIKETRDQLEHLTIRPDKTPIHNTSRLYSAFRPIMTMSNKQEHRISSHPLQGELSSLHISDHSNIHDAQSKVNQEDTTRYLQSRTRIVSFTSSLNNESNSLKYIPENEEELIIRHPKKRANKRTLSAKERYSKLTSSQLQRRLVANARERSRVHALSNAFNLLRCSIPSYSTEQKLSKLTILRVAINYINALENLLQQDPNDCKATPEFAKYVDECSSVLQTEYGRSKSKHGASSE